MICEIDCFLHTFSIEVCIQHCISTENQTTI
ncbi:hypothetical protein T4B_5363 [Trichinella pseudospiralis]|uniref:Uncharacterized protein n=1 Tax=Trichinella pseudospiralis TaxID=6337 RepID=A0A0V1GFE4_TRIPS|nr:hypothetical protein T4B_5363 [Trichinella pseudospiralis]KRZ01387.1 hypothetical protein T4C_10702 [Trichinella pseudospiralis]